MAEQAQESVTKKPKTEITMVKMSDGRDVGFAGKRKVNKETLVDDTKVEIDGDIIQLKAGAVSVRMDFRNGETRTIPLPLSLLAKFAGHGGEQKFGDELAAPAEKPLSEDDMVIAIDDLNNEIQAGKWGKGRAAGGGGVSGASIVIQAVLEATNARNAAAGKPLKTLQDIKDYFTKRLASEATKPEDQRISRKALYDSFKVETSETGKIIARMEAEKRAKEAAKAGLDANDALGEIAG